MRTSNQPQVQEKGLPISPESTSTTAAYENPKRYLRCPSSEKGRRIVKEAGAFLHDSTIPKLTDSVPFRTQGGRFKLCSVPIQNRHHRHQGPAETRRCGDFVQSSGASMKLENKSSIPTGRSHEKTVQLKKTAFGASEGKESSQSNTTPFPIQGSRSSQSPSAA